MAGNFGKFKDRSPIICAAGKPTGDPNGETVASTLKQYSLEDTITAIKHEENIWKEDVFEPPLKLPPIKQADFQGTETEIKPIMNPPVQTRYQALLQDLSETSYDSYWNKPIGKGRDQVPGLPIGMVPINVTFGTPSTKDIPLKELVNPPKTPYQVLWDSQVAHEMYKKTHDDYNASEKITRGYISPSFIPTKCFGIKTKFDPRGICVRCCCDWHIKEPVVHASKFQADYMERVRPQLGKVLAPNHNIECVPKGHTFGDKTIRTLYGVEELLKESNCQPCIFKRDFYKWISSLNKLKLKMKERANQNFDFDTFYKKSLYFDKDRTGLLPISTFYELCACHRITFPKENVESLLKVLNIIIDDKIDYKRFIDIINFNSAPLELKPLNDIPQESLHYITSNQVASCDYLVIDNSCMPVAGLPSVRTDLQRPIVPPGQCRADLDHLGDYTSANALVNPSIYTSYGLNFRDFFMPRSVETLRKLFEKIGYSFPGGSFDKIWKEGLKLDQTGLVCVDTFKSLLKSHFPLPKLSVDEIECNKMQ